MQFKIEDNELNNIFILSKNILDLKSSQQWQSQPLGRPRKIDAHYLSRLQELLLENPRCYGYPFRRWTIDWIRKHLEKELGVGVSIRHLKRLLKELDLSTCSQSASRSKQLRVVITDLDPDPVSQQH